MGPPTVLSASILSADFTQLGAEIEVAEGAGVDWIHVDVMDGQFVPNITMGPVILEACRQATSLPLDVHLMIDEPVRFLDDFTRAGADTLTVHAEACTHLHRTLQQVRELGARAGVALNPATPARAIEPVLDLLDLVLVMTVNPGFAGQDYLHSMVPKIREVRRLLDSAGSEAYLQVDGGINTDTAPQVMEAGADVLAAASSIFTHPEGIEAGVLALREAAQPSPA